VLTPQEVLRQEHWQARKTFAKASHPAFGLGPLPVTGKMSRTLLRVKWVSANIGEDNEYIFKKYGLKGKADERPCLPDSSCRYLGSRKDFIHAR